jgi:AAHS family 4-hydroxybenzoate transporter-like MFS transporter
MSPLLDRYGPIQMLPAAYVFAALCIATIGMAGSSVPFIIVTVFGAGFGIIGGQITRDGIAAKG